MFVAIVEARASAQSVGLAASVLSYPLAQAGCLYRIHMSIVKHRNSGKRSVQARAQVSAGATREEIHVLKNRLNNLG